MIETTTLGLDNRINKLIHVEVERFFADGNHDDQKFKEFAILTIQMMVCSAALSPESGG